MDGSYGDVGGEGDQGSTMSYGDWALKEEGATASEGGDAGRDLSSAPLPMWSELGSLQFSAPSSYVGSTISEFDQLAMQSDCTASVIGSVTSETELPDDSTLSGGTGVSSSMAGPPLYTTSSSASVHSSPSGAAAPMPAVRGARQSQWSALPPQPQGSGRTDEALLVKKAFVVACLDVDVTTSSKGDNQYEYQETIRVAFDRVVPRQYRGSKMDSMLFKVVYDRILDTRLRHLVSERPDEDVETIKTEVRDWRRKLKKTSNVRIGEESVPKRIMPCVRLRNPFTHAARVDPHVRDAVRRLTALNNDASVFGIPRADLLREVETRWADQLRERQSHNTPGSGLTSPPGSTHGGSKRGGAERGAANSPKRPKSVMSASTEIEQATRPPSPFRVKPGMLMPMKVQENARDFVLQIWCPGQKPGCVKVRTGVMSIRIVGTLYDSEHFDPSGTFIFDECPEVEWVRTYDFPSPVVPKDTEILSSNNGLAVIRVRKVIESEHVIVG